MRRCVNRIKFNMNIPCNGVNPYPYEFSLMNVTLQEIFACLLSKSIPDA